MKRILFILFLITGMLGCSHSPKKMAGEEKQITDTHNARNSLDYQGVYVGTTLNTNSSVINVVIALTESDYLVKLTPLVENAKTTEQRGQFVWDKSGSIITLKGISGILPKYFVGEGYLRQLDAGGNQRKGEEADNYTLRKQWNF